MSYEQDFRYNRQRHSRGPGSPWLHGAFWAVLLVCMTIMQPAAMAKPPILSGSEIDYPPFCTVDKDGRAIGFSVELMREALGGMGREVVFRIGPWAEVKGWLEQGEVQALPLVGRTVERESVFDFTFPYMSLHGAIVVRTGTSDIQDLNDLRGRRVAVMKGDNAEEFLRREDRGVQIHTTATFEEALHELSEGRHDAVVIQRLVALRLIQETGITNLRIVNKPIDGFRQDFCFAVKEGDRDTLALLNEGLALVMADGTYRHLHAKWFAALELPSHRRIVIGGDHNYPPYEYLDENGRPAGYNVELTRAIAQEVGLDIEIRLGPWAEIRQQLVRGEIDAIQGMLYSPERDLSFDFAPPHTVNNYVGVLRKGEGAPPATVGELKGRRIVVQQGDIMHDFAVKNGLQDQLAVVDSQEEALRELAQGRHDCALVSRRTAMYWIKKHGWENLTVGGRPLLSPEYCYAVPRGQRALLAQLSEGLKVVEETGEYRRIHEKWMGVYDDSPPSLVTILSYAAVVVTPLLLLLMASFLWSWSLRKQVARRTAELREREEYQRTMIACSPVALYSIDLEGRVSTWNASAERIFGWSAEEVIGRPLPIVPRDKQEEFAGLCAQLAGGQSFVGMEVVRVKKDGTLFDGSLSAAPIRDADGRIIGLMGAMEDITERKRIEKAIRESEKQFRSLAEGAPEAIFIQNNTRFAYVNQACIRLLGAESASDLVGRPVLERFHPDDHGRVRERLRVLNEERKPVGTAIETMISLKGEAIPVEVAAVPFEFEGCDAALLFARDVRARIKAERDLEESERRFRRAVEEAPFPIMIHAEDGQVLALSRAWKDITGYAGSEIATIADWVSLAYGGRSEEVRSSIADIYDLTARKSEGEFEIICKDGSRRVWEFSSTPLGPLPDGRRVVISMAADVTERKQAEETLRESEARYRELFVSNPHPMWVYDLESLAFLAVNDAAISHYGYSRDKFLSMTIKDIRPADDVPQLMDNVARVSDGLDKAGIWRHIKKDGSVIQVEITSHVLLFDQRRAEMVLVNDVTERMRMEEEREKLQAQLVQAQKMESVGRLAGGVAHDYNNMLSVIIGYTELLMGKVGPNDPLNADLKEILNAAKRSTQITRQLLAFARKQTISPKVLDLNEIVESMLKMLRRLIGEDIDLVWLPGAQLWPVKMDPAQIDQLLANLCVNARDAIAGVGKVTIETDKVSFDEAYCADHVGFVPGEFVLLALSDNGRGMDKETLDRIFEPFFTTKNVDEGTGLGLAMVYGIVKQNNGFINVYSEPGKGTTFRIYLPRHAGEAGELRAESAAEIPLSRGETVLLVEDEPAIMNMGKIMLEKLGYQVLAAGRPSEAMRLAGEHVGGIHLLITDVVMPEMNGRDLAHQLHTLCPDIKTLFMSGYTANVIAIHGVLKEGVQFIQKPFSMKDLAVKVREVLGQE